MDINIGIEANDRKEIAQVMSNVLADTYWLYLRTHNYHWNVKGELFHQLHEQFEEQYLELADAVDEIAERIRALGERAPGTFKEFNELTSLKEGLEEPEALDMVKRLAIGNEKVLKTAKKALEVADDAGDEATVDLLTQRLHLHAKVAWMLRSHLE